MTQLDIRLDCSVALRCPASQNRRHTLKMWPDSGPLSSAVFIFLLWLAVVCEHSRVTAETELSETEPLSVTFGYQSAPEHLRPEKWKDNYSICGLQRQSPIAIQLKEAVHFNALAFDVNALQFDYHDNATGWVVNNGHTVEFRVQDDPARRLKITGGLLDSPYDLIQFHWHWGSEDSKGSEHTLNGRQYAGELHFVHINERYNARLADIKTNKDGVAVMGVFVEIGDEPHEGVEHFLQHVANHTLPGEHDNTTAIRFPGLRNMLPSNTRRFYRYLGSLTTPPCYEVVIWTVFEEAIKISRDQIKRFRNIVTSVHNTHDKRTPENKTPKNNDTKSAAHLMDNFRPLQPINGRTIFISFPENRTELLETTDLHLHNWGYYDHNQKGPGPADWKKTYPACGGYRQSPIHIQHNQTVHSPQISVTPWRLTMYDTLPTDFTVVMENNGHTAVVLVGEGVRISGGGLPADYRLIQFHWHWGSHNGNGSEHWLDGKQYPAELHLVHTNMYYGADVKRIEGNHDGLAVLGVFIQVGDHNSEFDPILAQFPEVAYLSDTKKVQLRLTSLRHLLPDDISQFYRYYGSLTTPPCNEIVMWTVFRKPISMSQTQLDNFRSKLFNEHPPEISDADILVGGYEASGGHHGPGEVLVKIVDNFRPPQPLHRRVVFYGNTDLQEKQRTQGHAQPNAAAGVRVSMVIYSLFLTAMTLASYIAG